MGIWPFSRNKTTSSISKPATHYSHDTVRRLTGPETYSAKITSQSSRQTPRSMTAPILRTATPADAYTVPTLIKRDSRPSSQLRPSNASRKLSKSPGSQSVGHPKARQEAQDSAIPLLPEARRAELNRAAQAQSKDQHLYHSRHPYHNRLPGGINRNSSIPHQPWKHSSQSPDSSTVSPRRSDSPASKILRRKSSKRKAEELAREREIRGMSSPIPIPKRPHSYHNELLARDRRLIPGALNRKLERPLSEVSLPLPCSVGSQAPMVLDQTSFRVRTLDVLSPRPVLQCSSSTSASIANQTTSGALPPTGVSRILVPQESRAALAKSRRRIDDLADDMNASVLRDLMERDGKRAERQRRSDNERIRKELRRSARKQQHACEDKHEERKRRVVEDHLPNKRALNLRHTRDGNTFENGMRTPESWLRDPSNESLAARDDDPFIDNVSRDPVSYYKVATPTTDQKASRELVDSEDFLSPLTPPVSPTGGGLFPQQSCEVSEEFRLPGYTSGHNAAESSKTQSSKKDLIEKESTRLANSWKTLFRRSDSTTSGRNLNGRHSVDDPRGRFRSLAYSNTNSRESFSRRYRMSESRSVTPFGSTAGMTTTSTGGRDSSTCARSFQIRCDTPTRSQSIFREDLPEFTIPLPLSPSTSRVHSPENVPLGRPFGTRLPDIPISFNNEKDCETQSVACNREAASRYENSEVEILPASLASVDAEGSWLTGKPLVKRGSITHGLFSIEGRRASNDRLPTHGQAAVVEGEPDVTGTPPGRYISSLTPYSNRTSRQGDPNLVPYGREGFIPRSTADMVSRRKETWHTGAIAHQPTIVGSEGLPQRTRSQAGLLNEIDHEQATAGRYDDDFDNSETEDDSDASSGSKLQRAMPIEFSKASHVRHISAGSARLLNLSPTNQVKRMSALSDDESLALGTNDVSGDVK